MEVDPGQGAGDVPVNNFVDGGWVPGVFVVRRDSADLDDREFTPPL